MICCSKTHRVWDKTGKKKKRKINNTKKYNTEEECNSRVVKKNQPKMLHPDDRFQSSAAMSRFTSSREVKSRRALLAAKSDLGPRAKGLRRSQRKEILDRMMMQSNGLQNVCSGSVVIDIGARTTKVGVVGESMIRANLKTPEALSKLMLGERYNGELNHKYKVLSPVPFKDSEEEGFYSMDTARREVASLMEKISVHVDIRRGELRKDSATQFIPIGAAMPVYLIDTCDGSPLVTTAVTEWLANNGDVSLTKKRNLIEEHKTSSATFRHADKPMSPNAERKQSFSAGKGGGDDNAFGPVVTEDGRFDMTTSKPDDDKKKACVQGKHTVIPIKPPTAEAMNKSLAVHQASLHACVLDGVYGVAKGGLVLDLGFRGTRAVPVVHQLALGANKGHFNTVTGLIPKNAPPQQLKTPPKSLQWVPAGSSVSVNNPDSGMKAVIDNLRLQILTDTQNIERCRALKIDVISLLTDDVLQDFILQYGVVAPPPGHPKRESVLTAKYNIVLKTTTVSGMPNLALESVLVGSAEPFDPFSTNESDATAYKSNARYLSCVPSSSSENGKWLPLAAPGDEVLKNVFSGVKGEAKEPFLFSTPNIFTILLQSLLNCHPWYELPYVASTLVITGGLAGIPNMKARITVTLAAIAHRINQYHAKGNNSTKALLLGPQTELQVGRNASSEALAAWRETQIPSAKQNKKSNDCPELNLVACELSLAQKMKNMKVATAGAEPGKEAPEVLIHGPAQGMVLPSSLPILGAMTAFAMKQPTSVPKPKQK